MILTSYQGYSQKIPDDFKLFATINSPKDLKWGIPGAILIDSTKKLMIVEYDYNPTYLDFYSIEDMKFLKRVKTKGHVYMDNSYFYQVDNAVYIDKGRYKNNYIKIDLNSYTQTKVSCDKVPLDCPYEKIIDNQVTYFEDKGLTISNNEWYILKYDDYKLEIYLKTTTPQHTI